MLLIDRLEQAIAYLEQGHILAKCTQDYPELSTEQRVAGQLMSLTQHDWWHVVLAENSPAVIGMMAKAVFDKLYRNYYLQTVSHVTLSELSCYAINDICEIQEAPRYRHQIESWQEMISRPGQETGFNQ